MLRTGLPFEITIDDRHPKVTTIQATPWDPTYRTGTSKTDSLQTDRSPRPDPPSTLRRVLAVDDQVGFSESVKEICL